MNHITYSMNRQRTILLNGLSQEIEVSYTVGSMNFLEHHWEMNL
jgi:hypothetical protein